MSLIVSVNRSEIIPAELKDSIESRIRKGLLGPLAVEREAGAFMLYCIGNDFADISLKTNFPVDVLYVTAAHYDWIGKSAALRNKLGDFNPLHIQKDLTNSLMITTYLAIQEQLAEVLSGRKKASECPLIPKNIKDLERFMAMISNVYTPETTGNGTTVHAQNVQIINNPEIKQVSPEKEAERAVKYKVLRGETE